MTTIELPTNVEINHARAICYTCKFDPRSNRAHSLIYWEDREELESWVAEHRHLDEDETED